MVEGAMATGEEGAGEAVREPQRLPETSAGKPIKAIWLVGQVLSADEVKELESSLQKEPRRFETVCDQLMEAYRIQGSGEAFGLLYQINRSRFARIIQLLLRGKAKALDADDVLSEVFLAIYLYPNRFRAEKQNAFRNWSYSIIRNKVFRMSRVCRRDNVSVEELEEVLEDETQHEPVDMLTHVEDRNEFMRDYLLMLIFYRQLYDRVINDRERRALWMVDVEGRTYADASVALDVRIGNFKMILCRARKKIRRAFEAMAPAA
jgi:RNA polymerase sigma factor (sigma-70 family)